jgi:hypothetical protein
VTNPLDVCGCGSPAPEAERPTNRAGLDRIAYRIGRHGDFLARMLDALPRQAVPDPRHGDTLHTPLAALTTRAVDDPTISLLDAWALVLDVLAFYDERIANEAYLPTATERLSVRELARAIGYELRPALAAETRLAFTVESADDPFRTVHVPAGLQAMSVPQAPGELPQVFETQEDVDARADFNAIPPRLERPQVLALHLPADAADPVLVLIDVDDVFDLADIPAEARLDVTLASEATFFPLDETIHLESLLEARALDLDLPPAEASFVAVAVEEMQLRGVATQLRPGDRVVAVGRRVAVVHALPLMVREVEVDAAYAMTRVVVQPLGTATAPASPPPPPPPLKIQPSKQLTFKTPILKVGKVDYQASIPLQKTAVTQTLKGTTWSAAALQTVVKVQKWSVPLLLAVLLQPPPAVAAPIGTARPGLHALRTRVGFFGSAAPKRESLAVPTNQRGNDGYGQSWDDPPRPIWQTSQGVGLGAEADVYLERAVDEVTPDGWVVIETPDGAVTRHLTLRVGRAATVSRTDFGISGKATALVFNALDGGDFSGAGDNGHFTFRRAQANVASARLEIAGLPIKGDVGEGTTELTLERLVLDLLPGRAVAVIGERADAAGVECDEIALVQDVRHVAGFTRLTFASGIRTAMRRPSVRVNANVARASHGETAEQVLGSGDATRANQAFALQKLPLTFLADIQPPGLKSTLEVRVDGIMWHERASLYEAGPEDRVFAVRMDEDGTTRVVFGDGVRGARLPTGRQNVTARYRSGAGRVGEVAEGAIMLLRTRPLGIRAVTNPDASAGSAEAEAMEEARKNAPTTVRTLDRIVSLPDYEDTARTWPGFAKARAESLWQGTERLVHVTVGLASGEAPLPTDQALVGLRNAIDAMRDGSDRVLVQGFTALYFAVSARLVIDPDRRAEDVEEAARAALEAAFGFAAMELAAPVTGAKVIAVLHGVPGVRIVHLDQLALADTNDVAPAGHSALLRAQPARLADDDTAVLPASLLLVSPAHIDLHLEPADAD